jgi:hypothetical protein
MPSSPPVDLPQRVTAWLYGPNVSSILLLYLTLACGQLLIHNKLVDLPYQQLRQAYHVQFMNRVEVAPHQYRVLTPLGAAALQKVGVEFRWSYLLWRGLWLFAAALLLHLFLEKYVPFWGAVLGVVFLFAFLPLTYLQYISQESDAPNLVFYLLGYLLIESRRDGWFAVLLAVSMLNRETPVFLPLLWLFQRGEELPWPQVVWRSGAYFAIVCAVYAGLRLFFGHLPGGEDIWYWAINRCNTVALLCFLIGFGWLLGPALEGWRSKPKFLRSALLWLPLFVIPHLYLGYLTEINRYLLPVLPIILALALVSLWPSVPAQPAEVPSLRTLSPVVAVGLYVLLAAGCWGATQAYYAYYRRSHEQALGASNLSQWHFQRGMAFVQAGLPADAAREWEAGVGGDPRSFLLNYNLSMLYSTDRPDPEKALYYYRRAHQISPLDPALAKLEALFRRRLPTASARGANESSVAGRQ